MRRYWPWLLAVAGAVFGILGQRSQHQIGQPGPYMAADLIGGLVFLGAGLLVWRLRPGNPCWWLLMATGFTWFVGTFHTTGDSDAQQLAAFAFMGWYDLFLVWLLLAFPTGRLPLLRDRVLLGVLVAVFAARSLSRLFLFVPPDGTGCECAPNRFLPITDRRWFDAVEDAFLWGYSALIVLALVSVTVRWRRTSRPGRQMLAPVMATGAALAAGVAYDYVVQSYVGIDLTTQRRLFYLFVALRVAAAVAIVVGLRRLRGARSAVADLVADLDLDHEDAAPAPLGDALRRALGDSSLVLLPWSAEAGGYVDEGGRRVPLPAGEANRAVTLIERRGAPVAALVHDAVLLEDPGLVNGVVAAVRLTADNERLRAEVEAQLAEVAASRSRILAAGDAERRRIERDLHDGAQQRLVTVALALRLAEARIDADGDPQVRTDLSQAVKDLGEAIDELRDLARGIHPSILSEAGLVAALESLADRSAVPVTLHADLPHEPSAPVAAAAYFAVAEALTNIAKHAHAHRADVRAVTDAGRIRVTVIDDGVGGADATLGSGLRGITDRIAASGGSLQIDSPAGGGTRLEFELPCASS